MRERLTTQRIEALQCPAGKKQVFLWDKDTRSLAVRATKNERAFVFQGTLDGRSIRITIGSCGTWTIAQARERARELQRMIDRGIDPRDEIRRQQQAAEAERQRRRAAQVLALDVWLRYCEERRSAWGPRHHADHLQLVQAGGEPKKRGPGLTQPGPLRELLSSPLAELDAQAVEAWAARHAPQRPTVARLALRLLSVFLNWCRAHPDYQHALPRDGNPAKSRKARETLGAPRAKKDALQREQLATWFAVARQQDPVIGTYLQTLLLTGARPGEILGLRWDGVDFEWRSLTIRDKVEGERTIPLAPYVARLLSALPRRGPYVFMSGRADGPISSPNHAALRVCRIAGVPPVTLHGLRRSFGTLAEWVEAPAGVVAQIMGHKPSAIAERHYRARPLDLLRQWHTRVEAWILQQAGIEQPKASGARSLALVVSANKQPR